MKTILLDNGHGGLINGSYQTEGKRSPLWDDGTQLFEGEFNRAIVNGIIEQLTQLGIPYVNIAPELYDVELPIRTSRANKWYNDNIDCVYISIHSNAGGGSGFEAYTYHGETKSDKYASIIYSEVGKQFPTIKLRTDYSDGDADKESSFHVLKYTKMPSILCEWFFMDNYHECKEYLMRTDGRQRIIDTMVSAIQRIVKDD